MRPLVQSFYRRHPAKVAPDLLGMVLVRRLEGTILAGRIVETEAYCSTDPASHTFRGMTERNKAMFGEVGRAYIYLIHGMHYCINVTARSDTPAGGVLIRALEPLSGIELMRQRRRREKLTDLASGPGKLAQALGIDKSLYGVDMTVEGLLFIAEPELPLLSSGEAMKATPRIGISQAVEVPWRFVIDGNEFVSKVRK